MAECYPPRGDSLAQASGRSHRTRLCQQASLGTTVRARSGEQALLCQFCRHRHYEARYVTLQSNDPECRPHSTIKQGLPVNLNGLTPANLLILNSGKPTEDSNALLQIDKHGYEWRTG
jgi:hypothetical protein